MDPMNRLLLPFILVAFIALPLVACEAESTESNASSDPADLPARDMPVVGGSASGGAPGGAPGDTGQPDAPAADPSAEPTSEQPSPGQPDVLTPDGGIGAPCEGAIDCQGTGAVCLTLPGGYCALEGCAEAAEPCPDGSSCFSFQDGSSYCIQTCSGAGDCRQSEGYICDVDQTCWPGADIAANVGGGGGGESPVGGACETDADCMDPGASCYPAVLNGAGTGFVDGYCLINDCVVGGCPAGSSCREIYANGGSACVADCEATSDCRDTGGYACFSPGMCFPGCGVQSTCPDAWACGGESICEPACTDQDCPSDKVCGDSGLCEEPPCVMGSCPSGMVCEASGDCVPDLSDGPGLGPGPACPNLPVRDCTGTQEYCGQLIPFEPVQGEGYVNYPLNGETWANQYRSYVRRDLMMLVKWASAYVACKAGDWQTGNGYPLGLGDMSEGDGAIPGTSDNQPGHPAGTHEAGYDIDMAYFQNHQTGILNNHLRPICEHKQGGQDQYHCVGAPYLLDVWRTALFIGALFSSDRTRVIGVDGKVGSLVSQALQVLCGDGWLPAESCVPANQTLACEVEDDNGGLCWKENGSGWFHFHHHHMHLSLWQLASNFSNLGATEPCQDPPCMDMFQERDFLKKAGLPGLVKSVDGPSQPVSPWATQLPLP